MLVLTQTAPPHRCPRCDGALYRGYDGDLCCLACGECIYLDVASVGFDKLAVPSEKRSPTRPGSRKPASAA